MKKSETLSGLQIKIYEFIKAFKEEYSYSPSIRDIQGALTISSTSVVDYNLKRLEELKLIRRDRKVSRTIELVEQVRRNFSFALPIAGFIAAGSPIPVMSELVAGQVSETTETIEITPDLVGRYAGREDGLFALRVKGNSMIEDLINDGDIVVMHSQDTAEEGQTVAAWLEDEKITTLKRYYRDGKGQVRLQPANATMDPIFTSENNLTIQGRVVAVIRQVF